MKTFLPVKALILWAALIIQVLRIQAQQIFPDLGAIPDEEIKLSAVSFDPEADAVILRKDAIVFPGDDNAMITRHRVRMKILQEDGTRYGDVKLRHQHLFDYEQLRDVEARVYNFDEKGNRQVTMLSPKDIFVRKADDYFTNTTFSLPGLRKGTIVEYTYTIEQRSYSLMERWYFQDELPVMSSCFDFTILPNAAFSYRVMKSPAYVIDIKQDKAMGKMVFRMTSLPGLPDEPFMDAANDYLQRVELQLSHIGDGLYREKYISSWEEASRRLLADDHFGAQIDKDIPGAEDIVGPAKMIPGARERVRYVYQALERRMRWNGYYGLYTTSRLKQAFEAREGNVADLNLVLVNVLRSAGVPADPMLVSERKNGRVNTQLPFLTQFNKVIAYVSVEGDDFYLDLTTPQSNISMVPWELLNTAGFLVHKKSSAFHLISDEKNFLHRSVNLTCTVHAKGELEGEALVFDKGYKRMASLKEIRQDKPGYGHRQFQRPYPGINIDSFAVRNAEQDSLPLEQLVQFRYALTQQTDYLILSPPLFLDMEANPFISPTRFTDINFGSRQRLTYNAHLRLPDGLTIDALPKDITLIMPDTSIQFSRMLAVIQDGRSVIFRLSIEFRKSAYTASAYPALHAFYKKMYGLLNEPILLKKAIP